MKGWYRRKSTYNKSVRSPKSASKHGSSQKAARSAGMFEYYSRKSGVHILMQIAERANFVIKNISFRQFEKGTRFMHFSDYKSKLLEIDQTKQYLLKLSSESEKYLTMPDLNSNQKFILKERKSFFRKLFRFTTASYVCLMSQIHLMCPEDIEHVLVSLKQLDSIQLKHPGDKISQSYVKIVEDFLQAKQGPTKSQQTEDKIFECYKELYRVTLNELTYLDSLQELRMFECLHKKIKCYFQTVKKAELQSVKSMGEIPMELLTPSPAKRIGIARSKTFILDD